MPQSAPLTFRLRPATEPVSTGEVSCPCPFHRRTSCPAGNSPAGLSRGVNQVVLDVESKYVARELEDQLIHSMNELKEKLAKWCELTTIAEEELLAKLAGMPDRERLAIRC